MCGPEVDIVSLSQSLSVLFLSTLLSLNLEFSYLARLPQGTACLGFTGGGELDSNPESSSPQLSSVVCGFEGLPCLLQFSPGCSTESDMSFSVLTELWAIGKSTVKTRCQNCSGEHRWGKKMWVWEWRDEWFKG